MKTSEKKLIVLGILVAIAIVVLVPKGTLSFLSTAGGGINLKDLNQKDTTETKISVELQANQTTEQNLEQAMVIGDYFLRHNGFFIGAGVIGGISTEFGVCCPTMFVNGGLDFEDFRLEYKVGDFKRNTILTGAIDPQFSNFCIVLGEGSSAKNAMQISLIRPGMRIGFGHQNANSFYELTGGNWYAFAEKTICKISLSGGVDFGNCTTGFAAAKWCFNDNTVSLTANKLGTDNQNFVVSYNRSDIRMAGKPVVMSASFWAKTAEQGLHLVSGLKLGKSTLFAEFGSKLCQSHVKPYCGLGAVYVF